jgi:1-aminocyclopropane-1-carboxylate deaminase/D-cysteine desulfhydrase-like pyridoxal-dependent ACC family enzyme
MAEAGNMIAKTEGILLDPAYTGKTMAGLFDLIRKGVCKNKGKRAFYTLWRIPSALSIYSGDTGLIS